MKLIKRLIALALATFLCASAIIATANDSVSVLLNGTALVFDVPPQIINSRTMVPVRAIFEALGASVEWNGETRTVTSVKEDITIGLTIDDTTMYVNDSTVTLDSPACIIDGRTLVPVRAVSEAFGISVDWVGETRTVIIGEAPVYQNPLFDNGFLIVKHNGKWGYIDRTGKMAIEAKYSFVNNFSEGLAAVMPGNLYGYINTAGEMVIEPRFEQAEKFSEGLAAVRWADSFGYIDQTGSYKISSRYERAEEFSEGLAAVKLNGKWGYINKSGEMVIDAQFASAASFQNGVAAVQIAEGDTGLFKYTFIDTEGKILTTKQFDYVGEFSEGYAVALIDNLYGYINRDFEYAVEPKFDFACDFSDGLAAVTVGDKTGFIYPNGDYAVEPKFDSALAFSDGLASVTVDFKSGYINKTGEYVIEPQFWGADSFVLGKAFVLVDGIVKCIDKNGQFVDAINVKDGIIYDDGYILCTTEQNTRYIMDINGRIISDEYQDILP